MMQDLKVWQGRRSGLAWTGSKQRDEWELAGTCSPCKPPQQCNWGGLQNLMQDLRAWPGVQARFCSRRMLSHVIRLDAITCDQIRCDRMQSDSIRSCSCPSASLAAAVHRPAQLLPSAGQLSCCRPSASSAAAVRKPA
eukprot:365372-Chlamydomonas_euryale.AAC.1